MSIKADLLIFITALLFIVFNAIDMMLIYHNYSMPSLDSPLVSIQSFSDIDGKITIFQYLFIHYFLKLLGIIIFTVLIVVFSFLLKKSLAIMSTTIIITILPYMLYHSGIEDAKYISLTDLINGSGYVLSSAKANIYNDVVLLIVFILLNIVIIHFLIINTRCLYCYGYKN
jgi:hypothetical protein